MLLGQEVETDENLEWRVKWGQRGTGVFLLLGSYFILLCNILLLLYLLLFFLYFLVYCITKRLVRDCETIVTGNQRGDYSCVGSV